MDRQLAERMVGAACLLAVLVLVVPAILDGNPDSGAMITHPPAEESLDLRTHTLHLDRAERDPPVPTAAEVVISPVASPLPVPVPTPVAEAMPAAEPRVPAEPVAAVAELPAPARNAASIPSAVGTASASRGDKASSGDWMVQLGSFSRRENADRLAAELKGKGFGVSVQGGSGSSGTLFRVRAGPEADRTAAEALAGRLAASGFPGGRIGRK